MKIVHISRNIPVKNLEGNRVILDIIKKIKEHSDITEQSILFPAEYIPKFPFLPSRFKKFSELTGNVSLEGNNLLFYKFIRIPGGNPFQFCNIPLNPKSITKFIRDTNVFHAHFIIPDGKVAKQLAKIICKPYIITIREGDLLRIEKTRNKKLLIEYEEILKDAKYVISVSPSIQKKIKKIFNIDTITIPHGIEEKVIEYKKSTFSNINESTLKICCCAQFIKRKNIDWVINSINSIHTPKTKLELIIIGDGPLKNELHNLCKNKENIIFTGHLKHNEVLNIFKECDLFILPSESETFGMVYLEAAAKGCIIVGLKNTGLDGYFTHMKNSFYIDSEKSLKVLLADILNGKFNLEAIKENSYNLINKEFTWKKVIKSYLNLYKNSQ